MKMFMLRGLLHGWTRIISVDTLKAETLLLYRGEFDEVNEEIMQMNIVMLNPACYDAIDICVSAHDVAVSDYVRKYDCDQCFQVLSRSADVFRLEEDVPILDNGNTLRSNGNI